MWKEINNSLHTLLLSFVLTLCHYKYRKGLSIGVQLAIFHSSGLKVGLIAMVDPINSAGDTAIRLHHHVSGWRANGLA